jgi:Acyl-CoA reductase (LuxC)
MTVEQRINAFVKLGNHVAYLSPEAFESLSMNARLENPWFTADNVKRSLTGVAKYLEEDKLRTLVSAYSLNPKEPKTVALVMAGNIPMVGFHDLLCVLISGHHAQLKLSSKDSKLIQYLIKQLIWLEPEFEKAITIKENKLENFDAVIATGSDNAARYFEYYFGKYSNIIRKNRTSCVILSGNESDEEIESLGEDVFSYFGLGCRNVSKAYVPKGYDFAKILSRWESYKDIIHHHKYCNNYDYQKSIMLVNLIPFLDNGFILLQENEKLVSPISVLYYEYYSDQAELESKLKVNAEKTQCVVGSNPVATVGFGKAQYPEVWDYADNVDTLKFLENLN